MASDRVSGRPDVLLIVLDTLTADAAGLGRAPARMPFLQGLADRGIVCPHAVANAPWTLPSHASLFSGLLPSEHRVDTVHAFALMEAEAGPMGRIIAIPSPSHDPGLDARWLPALLARSGYRTIAVSNNPWISRLTGFEHGFHAIRDPASIRLPRYRSAFKGAPAMRSRIRAPYSAYRALVGGGDLFGRDAVELASARAGAEDRTRPLFLFVNLIEAHAPYLSPHSRDACRAAGAGPRAVLQAMRLAEPRRVIGHNLGDPDGRTSAERTAHGVQRALHDAAATYLDGLVERLVTAVRARGRPCVTVVTSDHGESFGEDSATSHGFVLSRPALHVPLVVAGDGLEAAEVTSSIDLRAVYATVLGVTGIDAPDRPIASMLEPGNEPAVAQRDARAAPGWLRTLGALGRERIGRLAAIFRHPWELVSTGERLRLFDLARDPSERVDRAADLPDVVGELRAAIPSWSDDAASPGSPGSPGSTGAAGTRAGAPGLDDREELEMEDRLRALGYLE